MGGSHTTGEEDRHKFRELESPVWDVAKSKIREKGEVQHFSVVVARVTYLGQHPAQIQGERFSWRRAICGKW